MEGVDDIFFVVLGKNNRYVLTDIVVLQRLQVALLLVDQSQAVRVMSEQDDSSSPAFEQMFRRSVGGLVVVGDDDIRVDPLDLPVELDDGDVILLYFLQQLY